MSDYQATPELRFVERSVPAPELGENLGRITKILQQKWICKVLAYGTGEVLESWRDVPLVADE